MAHHITRNCLYPVPTDWMGQEQDDDNVGCCCYEGPDTIRCWYFLNDDGTKSSRLSRTWELPDPTYPTILPIDVYEVDLDATKYPLHAAAIHGCIHGPEFIEVQCGPSEDPNPKIADPTHLHEAYDMKSFYWDPNANGGEGAWSTPQFSTTMNDGEDDGSFGWDWVRELRNKHLSGSDNRIPADAPESFGAAWREYRQKLRDLPEAWAGVGTATHLIVWPRDPEQQEFDRQTELDPPHLRP